MRFFLRLLHDLSSIPLRYIEATVIDGSPKLSTWLSPPPASKRSLDAMKWNRGAM
ncbi:MAG: hypothetical protein Q8J66_10665 [Methylotenera sp.]|nr:hypothetical protein [Methylotenera sp.]